MRYFKNRIIAKSDPEYFQKEKSGRKNNTVRRVFAKEVDQMEDAINKIHNRDYKIVIENSQTGESFERVITDISYCGHTTRKDGNILKTEEIYVISFAQYHPDDCVLACDSSDISDEEIKERGHLKLMDDGMYSIKKVL